MITRQIIYNELTFTYARLDVQEDPEFADDGYTQIGASYTFTITGYVVGTSASDFKTKIAALRSRLQLPRKALTITQGDGSSNETLFEFGAGHDDDWGPLPGRLWLSNYAANSCRYQWNVKAYRKEKWNGTSVSDSDGILSISRRYAFAIDQNGLTTRTISGKLIVSSRDTPADKYRNRVCPPCPAWFHRVSQTYEQSENARELTFSVTDVEKYWTMPEGITDGQASFRVHLENNAVIRMTLSGWFSAPIDTWKPDMIAHITNLIEQKFPPGVQYFDTYDIDDEVYENKITFTISGQMGGTLDVSVMDILSGFGERPAGTTGSATVAGPYGGHDQENSGVTAGDAILYDAAGTQILPNANLIPPHVSVNVESREKEDGSWEPPSASQGISDEQKNSPYISYHDVFSYEMDNRMAVFSPKANGAEDKTFVQQTSAPVMRLVQAGYAVRIARKDSNEYLPKAPRPLWPSTVGAIEQWYVSPATEEVVTPDWSRFTIHWRYVTVRTIPANTTTEPVLYVPPTPVRLDDSEMIQASNYRRLTMPEGLLTPLG